MRTSQKLMRFLINKKVEKINKSYLDFIKNQEIRIINRERQINYLESLFMPNPIMSNRLIKSSLNNTFFNTKSSFFKKIKTKPNYNLPRLNANSNDKTIDTYKRMKNYKVTFKRNKNINSEEKIKRFLGESGFNYHPSKYYLEEKLIIQNDEKNKKNDNLQNIDNENNKIINGDKDKNNNNIEKIKDNKDNKGNNSIGNKININNRNAVKYIKKSNNVQDKTNLVKTKYEVEEKSELNNKIRSKKMNFEYYLQMQSRAEILLKPKIGDDSNDLINYIKAIKDIRQNLITYILSQINKTENRFNKEKPEVDINLVAKNKSLNEHKWKNLFYLKDYQKFFLDGLKEKISEENYRQMERKFRQIYNACFSESKRHFNTFKDITFSE